MLYVICAIIVQPHKCAMCINHTIFLMYMCSCWHLRFTFDTCFRASETWHRWFMSIIPILRLLTVLWAIKKTDDFAFVPNAKRFMDCTPVVMPFIEHRWTVVNQYWYISCNIYKMRKNALQYYCWDEFLVEMHSIERPRRFKGNWHWTYIIA